MITVHHLARSRSIRIPWLLEELGLEYEIAHHARHPETGLAPDALFKLHPLGKSPLIEDDGTVIAESGAIIEYLLDQYGEGRLRPPEGSAQRQTYNYWMHAAEGSFMNIMVMSMLVGLADTRPKDAAAQRRRVMDRIGDSYVGASLGRLLPHVEEALGSHPFFAGDAFTAADIQMGFVMLRLAGEQGFAAQTYLNCARWMAEISARPAYISAMQRAGL